MEYAHGGDILSAQARFGGAVLDFSANLNPLGLPEAVRVAAQRAICDAVNYPDPLCRALVAAIAAHDAVEPGQILCGNGAADLIFRLAHALRPRKALVTAPTFSEYAQALGTVGCQIQSHLLLPALDFELTEEILGKLTKDLDVCFLCTPNNPTGRTIAPKVMALILERCAANQIRLVVDECFLELTEGAGAGLSGFLTQYPNLVLLRAFTKSYAMPGLRLGYCLSADGPLLERLSLCAQPWSVSAPAQAAGLAALTHCADHPKNARALLAAERARLTRALTDLGLQVFPGEANYLLFRAPKVRNLKERLMARGILIRSCANYEGLDEEYSRVAVRLPPQNERLILALKEVV